MTDKTAETNLLKLATDLTIAWLSNPGTLVPADELPAVIQKIHGALAGLSPSREREGSTSQPEFTPAVSVRRSLASKDHIISMIDGKPYKMLRRHLTTNGLTPEQYRARFGLKADYPMVAENYAEVRRNLAKKIGLGRKAGTKLKTAKPGNGSRRQAKANSSTAETQS